MLPKIKSKVRDVKLLEKIVILILETMTIPLKEVIPAHQKSSVKPDDLI